MLTSKCEIVSFTRRFDISGFYAKGLVGQGPTKTGANYYDLPRVRPCLLFFSFASLPPLLWQRILCNPQFCNFFFLISASNVYPVWKFRSLDTEVVSLITSMAV